MGSWLREVRKPLFYCIKSKDPADPVVGSLFDVVSSINDLLDALGQTFAEALHIKVRCWGAFPKAHFGGQAIT